MVHVYQPTHERFECVKKFVATNIRHAADTEFAKDGYKWASYRGLVILGLRDDAECGHWGSHSAFCLE